MVHVSSTKKNENNNNNMKLVNIGLINIYLVYCTFIAKFNVILYWDFSDLHANPASTYPLN